MAGAKRGSGSIDSSWGVADTLAILAQILVPVAAILVALFAHTGGGGQLPGEIQLSIVGLGLLVPIIIMQISITRGHNRNDGLHKEAQSRFAGLDDRVVRLSPLLERVFMSDNVRMQRFVFRRLDETYRTVETAVGTMKSGPLRTDEYYEELIYLSELIVADKNEHSGAPYQGEIWAMTSFAEDEWTEQSGYEALWTVRLRQMVEQGILTRRLCILPVAVLKIITAPKFIEPDPNEVRAFFGFIELLQNYHGKEAGKALAKHSVITATDSDFLSQIRGFFAIKLASGELHILYGETVDKAGALTAEVLFDQTAIERVQKVFNNFMDAPQLSLSYFLAHRASQEFRDYCAVKQISLPGVGGTP